MDGPLNLLGHVIGLSATNPEVWTCSCGFSGKVWEMAGHMHGTIQREIDEKLAEAKAAGVVGPVPQNGG